MLSYEKLESVTGGMNDQGVVKIVLNRETGLYDVYNEFGQYVFSKRDLNIVKKIVEKLMSKQRIDGFKNTLFEVIS